MEILHFKATFKAAIQLVIILLFSAHTQADPIRSKDSNTVTPATTKQNTKPAIVTREIKVPYQPLKSDILDIRVEEIAPTDTTAIKKRALIHVDYKISVLISNPKDFLLQRPTDKTKLILFADGFPLEGMNSDYFLSLSRQQMNDTTKLWPDKMWIPFIFKRDSTNREAWNSIFHLAHWNKSQISFKLSIGWSGMFPITSIDDNKVNTDVTLVFYNSQVFWSLIICYFLFILLFVYLCHSTGLIRDPDLNNKGPYSLAQTQLAFWTVLIIGGFIYLIILTGLTDSLNDSILLLLGISGGTTGIASFIDYYKKQQNNKTAPTATLKKHRTFLLDILSDGINVSVQRTQTAMWNLVLGLYFIWYVITNKSMPAFSNTLLLVAGVSSVLYLGSKGPENPIVPDSNRKDETETKS
ncbi:hypothetical protein [Mucilaginibacter arboris]|uniref:Uncharacterized protein n=1 Tax=Mucilaginibacter arboris TaxID=2682090 RepID=A0A7K1SXG2_9SPHI|nr:hypothetical protein [Mucilaginibacter arboris]MVN22016.1 hypothetical protein [Mucilaginibacter arboris]